MQYPSIYSQIKAQTQAQAQAQPQFPEQEHLKCPRCDSTNTKFCYYNNYNLSQPRHFCKNCRRYWTKGGALRNIPVGGGSRKNNTKRSSSVSASSSSNGNNTKRPGIVSTASLSLSPSSAAASACNSSAAKAETETVPPKAHNYGGQFENLMGLNGSFSSLMGSSGGKFTDLLDGMGPNGSNIQSRELVSDRVPCSGHNMDLQLVLEGGGSDNNADGFLNIESGGGGWQWLT